MNWLRANYRRVRALFCKKALDADMNEELRSHLELRTQANIDAGMAPEEARLLAKRQFGGTESIKEECREQRGVRRFEDLLQDMRFGARQLRKNPGFAAVAVLTLALGIGANTAIFSVVHGVLLKPLPYPEPDRLVSLWERSPERGIEQERVSGPNYLDWREQNTVLTAMAVSPGWEGSETFNLVLGEGTVKVRGTYTSSSLFATLGTKPLLGRTLLPDEDLREGNRAAVLGYRLWQRHFAGDPNVIGQTLTLDTYGRRGYTIVGVMPPGFGVPSDRELWLPLGWMGVKLTERRSAHWHIVIGRLKPGVSLAQARTELSTIQARLKRAYPGETIGSEVEVVPLVDQAVGRNLRTALLMLWGVVAGVLLIACANVANLMLARAATRQREIALRLALGAGRGRIMRQLLAESLVLALAGGALGVLLAGVGLRLFVAMSSATIPRLGDVSLDGVALAFTAGICLATGVLFGLAPAWQFSRPDLNDALKEGVHGASAGTSISHTRNLLVVVEVALSVILLSGAGLMLQSFARMLQADRGIRSEHLITAELDFSVSGFTGWTRPTGTRPQVALKTLMDRLRALPGVRAVGAGSRLLRRENRPPNESISIFGRPSVRPEDQPKAEFKGITPDWLPALGARVLRGRDFAETDTLEAPGVVLINETLARRFFPNKDPIGQHVKMGSEPQPLNATNAWGTPIWCTIVGVVSDIKSLHARPEAVPEIYSPYWQWPMQSPTLLVRTAGEPAALAETIRRETKSIIPNIPPPVVRTMDTLLSDSVAQPRLQTALLSLFAALALLLAAIGLYGVLTYTVTQRAREIGIRLALGAQKSNVVGLVVWRGLKLAFIGAAAGMIGALALMRLIQTLLYGIRPTDPLTFAGVSVLLVLVALLACWLPARRAARVEPMLALRAD